MSRRAIDGTRGRYDQHTLCTHFKFRSICSIVILLFFIFSSFLGKMFRKYFNPQEDGFFDDYGFERGQYYGSNENQGNYE